LPIWKPLCSMINKMKPILIIYSFILLLSCETNSEVKSELGKGTTLRSDTATISKKTNAKVQTKNHPINCYYDKLSKQFNSTIEINQINEDSSKIFIKIFDKDSKKMIDNIDIQTQWLIIPPMFANCQNVRSLSTGVNTDKEVIDNEHGDFIVADFNFDDLDDFAIAVDFGGNGGTIYSFYLQRANGKFELDQFLTETMLRFPVAFDRKEKTLTTSVHANAYENSETVYQLRNGKWKMIEEKFVKL
jgi:hypothetical protein